jgi:hypothetical protein
VPAGLTGPSQRGQQALGHPSGGAAQGGIGGVAVAGQLGGEGRLVELAELR